MGRPPNVRMTRGGEIVTPVADWFLFRRGRAAVSALGPEPAGVDLRSTPAAPWAHDVFTPEEMAAREAAHAARVAAEEPAGEGKMHCCACGAVSPSHVYAGSYGWWSRLIPGAGGSVQESYCGPCFRRWRWGDEVTLAKRLRDEREAWRAGKVRKKNGPKAKGRATA